MFFSNLLLETNYELKNRYMHVDYVAKNDSQSIISKVSKSQFDTLECTLEELAILELVARNPTIKQQELAEVTGKSISTVKKSNEITARQELYPLRKCKTLWQMGSFGLIDVERKCNKKKIKRSKNWHKSCLP